MHITSHRLSQKKTKSLTKLATYIQHKTSELFPLKTKQKQTLTIIEGGEEKKLGKERYKKDKKKEKNMLNYFHFKIIRNTTKATTY